MSHTQIHVKSEAVADSVELADVFRACPEVVQALSFEKRFVAHSVMACRTAELGGRWCKCDNCGYLSRLYNSCLNRNCPKCLGLKTMRWVEAQKANLLPCDYRHASFAVPEEFNRLFLYRPKKMVEIVFAASAYAVKSVAADPGLFGARVGFLSTLHTWTKSLRMSVHVHCLIPEGGLSKNGKEWLTPKPGFFLPERNLAEAFRERFLELIQKALAKGKLALPDDFDAAVLSKSLKRPFRVFCKPAPGGPEAVLEYLSRNVYRTAVSNDRILSLKEGVVTFRLRRGRADEESRVMRLTASAFVKRFMLHVLPAGVMRVRHYGFLANSVRAKNLNKCRKFMAAQRGEEYVPPPVPPEETWEEFLIRMTGVDPTLCPICKVGHFVTLEEIPARALPPPGRGRFRKAS